MIVGVPKEVKSDEYRVAMLPVGAEELTAAGHDVLIEAGAGLGSGIPDALYEAAGASILGSAAEIWARAEMIVKVKEPQRAEWPLMRHGQVVFTYFHFAADEALTRAVIDGGITAIAYETIRDAKGTLPLLTPMSEVAGRMSIQQGPSSWSARRRGAASSWPACRASPRPRSPSWAADRRGQRRPGRRRPGGQRPHPGHQPGPPPLPRRHHAAERHHPVLRPPHDPRIDRAGRPRRRRHPHHRGPRPEARPPEDLARMKPGAVIVDVAIDQGGCVETSRRPPTASPTYVVDGIVHYCVTNMPGAVGRTSTYALNNVTLPYAMQFAGHGWREVAMSNSGIAEGVNVDRGRVTNKAVAATFGLPLASL
jgi:alanine dehydrogenase